LKRIVKNIIAAFPIGPQSWLFSRVEFLSRARTSLRLFLSKSGYAPSKAVEIYCTYLRDKVKNIRPPKSDIILIDCFAVPQWVMANSIFLNRLSTKLEASITSYGFSPREHKTNDIYQSFGAENHLTVGLTQDQSRRRNELYFSIMEDSKTPEELFNLHIDGIWLGLDLYESILRTGSPTVDMDSYHTRYTIYHGLRYFIFFYDLIQTGRVKAVAPSHDCYMTIGLLAKVAQRFNIPVFYANPYTIMRSYKNHDAHDKFLDYPKVFASLPAHEQVDAIDTAKSALSKRLGGVIGVDMTYQTKSAFTSGEVPRQTEDTDKLKVIVATHCFFDNPHAYRKMTFRDFSQWLECLGEISKKTDYEWYLKTHPDYLPGTIEILQEFTSKYSKFKVIDSRTTFHQLKEEGASVALTVYGSVGHELPLLGYHLINASYNPHSAYNFNIQCHTQVEYEQVLMKLDELPPIQDLDKIYEFYAAHNYLTESNELLFESLSDYFTFSDGDFLGDKCYEFFMLKADENVQRYSQHADAFLASDCHYDYEMKNVRFKKPR